MTMPQELPVSPYANTVVFLSFAEAERKSSVLFPIENNFRISGARSDLIYKRCRWDANEEKRWWGGLTWAGVRPSSWHAAKESPHIGRPCGWAAHRNNSTCCPCLTPLDHATALLLRSLRSRHHAHHTRPARHKTTC